MPKATVNFIFEKSTKGAHRFKEVDDNNNAIDYAELAVGTIYIKKSFFGDKAPKRLQIDITTQL